MKIRTLIIVGIVGLTLWAAYAYVRGLKLQMVRLADELHEANHRILSLEAVFAEREARWRWVNASVDLCRKLLPWVGEAA